jgi:hypothetical protein
MGGLLQLEAQFCNFSEAKFRLHITTALSRKNYGIEVRILRQSAALWKRDQSREQYKAQAMESEPEARPGGCGRH